MLATEPENLNTMDKQLAVLAQTLSNGCGHGHGGHGCGCGRGGGGHGQECDNISAGIIQAISGALSATLLNAGNTKPVAKTKKQKCDQMTVSTGKRAKPMVEPDSKGTHTSG